MKKFRLINVAWNSFRSSWNCVSFFSSGWWCCRCCCCCNHVHIGCFYVVYLVGIVDVQDISQSELSISESPSIFVVLVFFLSTLPVALCHMYHFMSNCEGWERKLRILDTCIHRVHRWCDGVSLKTWSICNRIDAHEIKTAPKQHENTISKMRTMLWHNFISFRQQTITIFLLFWGVNSVHSKHPFFVLYSMHSRKMVRERARRRHTKVAGSGFVA